MPTHEIAGTMHDVVAQSAVRPRGTLLPRQLSDAEFALFASAGTRRTLAPGERIFRRGELGRSMFVIESGSVRLEFGDGMPDKLIGAREFFGELALFIGNHSRVANAYAAAELVLCVVEHAAFEQLLDSDPGLLARFLRRSFSYLVASEQQLIQSLKRRNEDLMMTLDSLQRTRTELGATRALIQTDELTGLTNRRGLYQRIAELQQPDGAPGELRAALLLVDIDRFKQINDGHGHLCGDRVLQAVAQEIRSAAGPLDLPCRLGGDEFALLAFVADSGDLSNRALCIVNAVRELRFPDGYEHLRVTVSVGGCLASTGAQWAAWYSEADTAMYQVKGMGGDAWRLV